MASAKVTVESVDGNSAVIAVRLPKGDDDLIYGATRVVVRGKRAEWSVSCRYRTSGRASSCAADYWPLARRAAARAMDRSKPIAPPADAAEFCACGHARAWHNVAKKADQCNASIHGTYSARGCTCERFKRAANGGA